MTTPIDWSEQEVNYASQISDDLYHKLRTEFILRLFPADVNLVVDFGCGEGFFSELMLRRNLAKRIIGLDPSPNLIEIASKNKYLSHDQNCKISLGGVSELADIQESSVDLVIALNVLAYMKPSEESLFYKESSRILKLGGFLLVTHSNVLFDMFIMNNLTVDFFITNFKIDISEFLDLKELIPVQTYGIRENPLSYSTKLSEYGFKQLNIDFFHHHSELPRRSNNLARNQISAELELRPKSQNPNWQEFFISSTFGVLARLC